MSIMQSGPRQKKKSRWGRQTGALKVRTLKWFDLDRYSALNKLGALQWFNLIALRCYLLEELGRPEHPEDPPSTRDDLRRAIDEICLDPLNDHQSDQSFPDDLYWGWYSAQAFHWLDPSGVNLLTHRDLLEIAEWEEEKRKDRQSSSPSVDLDSPISCDNRLGEAVQLMSVDLNSADAVLIEQFTKNLSELRKVIQRPRAVESVTPPFEAWINHGVLPFLDLKLWSIAHNKWISNSVLAWAIYSDESPKGEGSIRLTTEVHANELVNTCSRTFRGLRIDARRERSYTNLAVVNVENT
jgi:Family of unknown function (DUF6387)